MSFTRLEYVTLPGFNINYSATWTLRAALTINRVPQTLGYNIAYFAIGLGLTSLPPSIAFKQHGLSVGILFLAAMFSKMQASIAVFAGLLVFQQGHLDGSILLLVMAGGY